MHFLNTHIAGFTYWDGCIAFENLKIGTELTLVRELDNKHDANAVAIYYNDLKLGFIPSRHNHTISQFLEMGHDNCFETRICAINPQANPEAQVTINIYIKRKPKK